MSDSEVEETETGESCRSNMIISEDPTARNDSSDGTTTEDLSSVPSVAGGPASAANEKTDPGLRNNQHNHPAVLRTRRVSAMGAPSDLSAITSTVGKADEGLRKHQNIHPAVQRTRRQSESSAATCTESVWKAAGGLRKHQNNHPAVQRTRRSSDNIGDNAAAPSPRHRKPGLSTSSAAPPVQIGQAQLLEEDSPGTFSVVPHTVGNHEGIAMPGEDGEIIIPGEDGEEISMPGDEEVSEEGDVNYQDMLQRGDNFGLAVAMPVESRQNLMTAVPVHNEEELGVPKTQELHQFARCGYFILGLAVIAGVAVLAVVLSIARSNDNEGSNESVPKVSVNDTTDIMIPMQELFPLPNYTRIAMKDPDSAQSKAYRWVLADPSLQDYTEWRMQQRFALATLYHATRGDQWDVRDGWMSYDVHECHWYWARHVSRESPCSFLGKYLVLWLRSNNLDGSIPPELRLMQWLADIQIEQNRLRGTIPTEIYGLPSLHSLWVLDTDLQGTLSTYMGQARHMHVFHFDKTNIGGRLPTELGELQSMRLFSGEETLITGTIPTEIGLCSSLDTLSFEKTNQGLSGTLPSEIGNLSRLYRLHLGSVGLSGQIPDGVWRLSELQELYLDGNSFSGTLSRTIGRLSQLVDLRMSENSFSGSIPSEMGLLGNLTTLLLDSNQLNGTLPEELSALSPNVTQLDVSGNSFVGVVPDALCFSFPPSVLSFDCTESLCGCNCSCHDST